ncbi:MAG: arsenite methyltransferase [Nitrososphaerota archaeon]|jgi:SAM-dependent methyltransferase|uniref:arsenite methyltransferase n=1 Tax=Candidatus Bathycorpusculum sp. TaxID=2994959 RepID=UPI00281B606A|nr:arsenite methyltransferase [Candidatus Termitimicrobium sp.]MCL2432679.1 arsenite methyltransferase [Candidatus Termitimicrobium sp.]MDR0493085.1 arsenite methyltransferase [Nitrososphaerota archaeon]
MTEEEIKKEVRTRYAKVAKTNSSCCAPSASCCSAPNKQVSKMVGYSEEEMSAVPEGANLGLGCGNPIALASLKEGERVLDLGSGAGFDVFLAAKKVGKQGTVIGVDMTPEMLDKARANAKKGGYTNVEFRLGEIENLPVVDNSVDVIISNCVINLAPNKKRVFEEAFRVLDSNGRLMVSDLVLRRKLPEAIQKNVEAYAGCISGAELKDKYLEQIRAAGFQDVAVLEERTYPLEYVFGEEAFKHVIDLGLTPEELKETANSIVSIKVSALKKPVT